MHVLHLIKTSEGAVWALDFIRELRQRHNEITFSVILPSGGKHFEKYFEICENVYDLDFSINAKVVKNGHQLRMIVKREEPDLIHSWFTQTTLYARLFLRDIKIPRLFEVVGPLHLELPVYRFFDIKSAQKHDFWKATSQYTYDKYLHSNILKENLFLNYMGIDVQKYIESRDKGLPVNLKKTYNIPERFKIIGTASYMYPPKLLSKSGVKNHELLLLVFKELLKRRDDIILIVGGSTLGPNKKYEQYLKKRAQKISKDRIIFTGFVPNLGRLISEFDVFVFLSLSENLGGVFESLLFEVPTVASNRGGIPELVINGETGFTCSLDSITEIADKIEYLLENQELINRFKLKGRLRVLEIFNKLNSIENSYNIYKKIIIQHASR